jgi:hypothetical protein
MSRVLDIGQINPAVQKTSEKGQINGYASLDASGNVPTSQMASSTPDDSSITGTLTINSNILIQSVTGSPIGDNFTGTTQQNYINFTQISGSSDPGFIMHETSSTITNEGVIHLCPSDDNSDTEDYVSIHGTGQPDTLKLYTGGRITGVTTLTTSGDITEAGTTLSSKYLGISATAANTDKLDNLHASSFLRSDATDTAGSKLTFSTGLARSAHNVGHLEGGHTNLGDSGPKTNPIYTIGSAYNPGDTTFPDMYGIGYSYGGSVAPIGGADGWGMTAVSDGDVRIFLDAQNGRLSTTSTIYEAGTALSSKYLGISAKAADTNLIDGYDSATTATINTAAVRNAQGDIELRLCRSNYSFDTIAAGQAMAHRVNNSTDNYIRFCSSTAAIRTWASMSETSHTHDNYLRSDADDDYTGGDNLQIFDNKRIDFGSSNDWRCYHNGTHNYMDLYTGDLYLRDNTTTRFSFARSNGYGIATNWYATSDRRLKENIKPLESSLSKVKQIAKLAVRYNRIDLDDKSQKIGFIAQDVEKVYPEFVTEDDTKDKIKSVNYSKMVVPLYKATSEMKQILEKRQQKINRLRKKLNQLQNG